LYDQRLYDGKILWAGNSSCKTDTATQKTIILAIHDGVSTGDRKTMPPDVIKTNPAISHRAGIKFKPRSDE